MNDDQTLNPTPTNDQPIKLDEFGVPSYAKATDGEPSTLDSMTNEPTTSFAPTMPIAPELPVVEQQAPQITEDLPLAFAGMPQPPVPQVPTELPPVAPAPLPPVEDFVPAKKSFPKSAIIGIIVAAFVLIGGGSWYAYTNYAGEEARIAAVQNLERDECSGCNDAGYQLKWSSSDGRCRVSGTKCNDNTNQPNPSPIDTNFNGPKGQYQNFLDSYGGKPPAAFDTFEEYQVAMQSGTVPPPGGTGRDNCIGVGADVHAPNAANLWCADGGGFCIPNDGVTTCRKAATDRGYTVTLGAVECKCDKTVEEGGALKCIQVSVNEQYYVNAGYGLLDSTVKTEILNACNEQMLDKTVNFGNGAFLCKVGVKNYNGGACVAENGETLSYIPTCFCGTIQVDTGNGHRSYASQCGCNQNEETPGPSPSSPNNPVLACTGLTKNVANAAIGIGTPITLTCAGAVSPAGATSLSYKFRYNINAGAWSSLVNATSTTASMTPDRCGTYRVQCQTCGTINGALVCDPTWTSATAQ